MVEIQLTDEDFRRALSEAMLAQLGTEGQKALITQAIENLCKTQQVKGSFGTISEGPSIIEQEFGQAVRTVARQIIHEMVSNEGDVRDRVEALVRAVITDMLNDERHFTPLAIAMSDAMLSYFTKTDRY